MAVTIKRYDDHRTAGSWDGGYPYIYLCDECAEERGVDVTYLETPSAGEVHYCEDCGNPNRAAEESEKRAAEAHIRSESHLRSEPY